MIQFVNVNYARPTAAGRMPILHNASASFPPLCRTAIFGAPGSGKTTVTQLISGSRQLNSGFILREASISPVIGHSAALNPNLSGYENVVHLARLAGKPVDQTLAFVQEFSELAGAFGALLGGYTANMRARLAFSLSYAQPYQVMLADEVIGSGDNDFKTKCQAMLRQRLKECGLILLAGQTPLAEALCDRFYALARGRLLRCATATEAFELANFQENPAAGELHYG